MKADWIGRKLYIVIPCGLDCLGLAKDNEGNEGCPYVLEMERVLLDQNLGIDEDCGKCWFVDTATLRIIFDCRYCP